MVMIAVLLFGSACTGGTPESSGEVSDEENTVAELSSGLEDAKRERDELRRELDELRSRDGGADGPQDATSQAEHDELPGVLGGPDVRVMGRPSIKADLGQIRVTGAVRNSGTIEALGSLHVELYDPGARDDEGNLGSQDLPMTIGPGHEKSWTAVFWADAANGNLAVRVKWMPA